MDLVAWWYGAIGLSVCAAVVYTLAVTVYLHRHSTHRAFKPVPAPLPHLAVADDRNDHQGVDGRSRQAPRLHRDRGRSPQPLDPRLEGVLLEGHRVTTVPAARRRLGQVRQGHAGRLVRTDRSGPDQHQ